MAFDKPGLLLLVIAVTVFSAGFVTPVTGPRPFDIEAIALLNVAFGAPRPGRSLGTVPPPAFGN